MASIVTYKYIKQNPDIILVTVGYRVGLMGFVDFSELKGGSNFADAPNLGILDQIESLRWVQKNIAFFGGDRKKLFEQTIYNIDF